MSSRQTPSPLGPLARSRFRKAGMTASLTLVLATGVVSPTAAAAASVSDDKPTATQQGGTNCRPHKSRSAAESYVPDTKPKPKDKCKGATGATGATGPKGATGATGATGAPARTERTERPGQPERRVPLAPVSVPIIDSTQDSNRFELRAALTPPVMGGPNRAYAGVRDLTGDDPGPFLWTDLTGNDNYPQNACGISVEGHAQGDQTEGDMRIDVITTTGQVYETTCGVNLGENITLTCDDPWALITSQPLPGADNSRNVRP